MTLKDFEFFKVADGIEFQAFPTSKTANERRSFLHTVQTGDGLLKHDTDL